MGPINILLVEDDSQTAQMVKGFLEREDFNTSVAGSGPEGERLFSSLEPHLVIMDLMLPGFDGLELCRRVRTRSNAPIMMLTARADDMDKAIGLGIGADDYLAKPFSPTELVARVRALLRRSYQYNEPPKPVLLGGPRLLLDQARREIRLDGQPLDLTPTEFELLKVLMTHPGWVYSRAHLLEEVWGFQDEAGEEIVTAHLSNLRRKLGPECAHFIRTVRGAGYAYEE